MLDVTVFGTTFSGTVVLGVVVVVAFFAVTGWYLISRRRHSPAPAPDGPGLPKETRTDREV